MPLEDRLVLKLPKDRVEELVALGRGSSLDPGHGRLMKEWINIDMTGDELEWSTLVEVAKTFVLNMDLLHIMEMEVEEERLIYPRLCCVL